VRPEGAEKHLNQLPSIAFQMEAVGIAERIRIGVLSNTGFAKVCDDFENLEKTVVQCLLVSVSCLR
jgi:hypothetical protein